MRSSNQMLFQELKESLQHVHRASRETAALLTANVEAFSNEVRFAEREMEQLSEKDIGKDRLRALLVQLQQEDTELKSSLKEAMDLSKEVQKYFAVSAQARNKLPPCEAFFGHIASFLDALEAAWTDVEKHPAKWQQFAENPRVEPKRRYTCSSVDIAPALASE